MNELLMEEYNRRDGFRLNLFLCDDMKKHILKVRFGRGYGWDEEIEFADGESARIEFDKRISDQRAFVATVAGNLV